MKASRSCRAAGPAGLADARDSEEAWGMGRRIKDEGGRMKDEKAHPTSSVAGCHGHAPGTDEVRGTSSRGHAFRRRAWPRDDRFQTFDITPERGRGTRRVRAGYGRRVAWMTRAARIVAPVGLRGTLVGHGALRPRIHEGGRRPVARSV